MERSNSTIYVKAYARNKTENAWHGVGLMLPIVVLLGNNRHIAPDATRAAGLTGGKGNSVQGVNMITAGTSNRRSGIRGRHFHFKSTGALEEKKPIHPADKITGFPATLAFSRVRLRSAGRGAHQ